MSTPPLGHLFALESRVLAMEVVISTLLAGLQKASDPTVAHTAAEAEEDWSK